MNNSNQISSPRLYVERLNAEPTDNTQFNHQFELRSEYSLPIS
jgi:hypothetical protein